MPYDRLCASVELQIKLQLCSDLNYLLLQWVRVRIESKLFEKHSLWVIGLGELYLTHICGQCVA